MKSARGQLRRVANTIKRSLRRPSLSAPDPESTDNIWKEVFVNKIYDSDYLDLRKNDVDVVMDVGSNIGIFAAWIARECRPKVILCYEASPVTFAYLESNVNRLGDIYEGTDFVAVNAAVSDTSGSMRTIYHMGDKTAASTMMVYGREREGIPYEVESVTISSQMEERGISVIDLLKIDVEGHHMEVLRGIDDEDFFKIKRIVMECDWIPEGAASHHDVKRFLESKGFSVVCDDPAKTNNVILFGRRT